MHRINKFPSQEVILFGNCLQLRIPMFSFKKQIICLVLQSSAT